METDLIKVLFFADFDSSRAEILPNERALPGLKEGTDIVGSCLLRVKLTFGVLFGEKFDDSVKTFGTHLALKHTHVSIGLSYIS